MSSTILEAPPGPPGPPLPLVRSCRAVVVYAGDVALALVGDPVTLLDQVAVLNPALAAALADLMDAVMDLDYRTQYLAERQPVSA